jgi:phage terminase large subunit-like protein
VLLYSADEPRQLRGPNFDFAWCDEICHWQHMEAAYDNLQFGLRIGKRPRQVITTTPKPLDLLKQIMAGEATVITKGSTYDNRANLAASYFQDIIKRYEGTTLGRQELMAELIDDSPDALWSRPLINKSRCSFAPLMERVVIGVDPATTSNAKSNWTGIIVAGLDADGIGYVLDDRSLRGSPNEWAEAVVAAYNKYRANCVIAETNQGGDLVRQTIMTQDARVAYKGVHAKRGKTLRAEPVVALYEQGRIKHYGTFGDLEDQMCQWVPGDISPDRLDAAVYALSELMVEPEASRKLVSW